MAATLGARAYELGACLLDAADGLLYANLMHDVTIFSRCPPATIAE